MKATATKSRMTSAGSKKSTSVSGTVKAKPSAAKGQYLKSVSVSSTMGPGVKINPTKVLD